MTHVAALKETKTCLRIWHRPDPKWLVRRPLAGA
jgi:hypothetical protein